MKTKDILTEIDKRLAEIVRLVNKAGVERPDSFMGSKWVTIDVYKPAKGVRLEQGKFYRTKGGRKVYIATDDKHWCYGIIEDNKVATVYERNGLVHYNRNEPVYPRDDIVSEWK